MNERMARSALAILLLAVVFAGSLVLLMNMPGMPVIYPRVVTYQEQVVVEAANASERVAIEQSSIQVSSMFDSYGNPTGNSGMWTSKAFPLKRGETVTVEFDVTPKPIPTSNYFHGVSLDITKGMTGYSSIFYVSYDVDGMTSPNECVVPEAGDYQVKLVNFEDHTVSVSFRLTVKSTEIVGGVSRISRSVEPYGTSETLMILWSILGVGTLVGLACAFLVRPKRIVQPVPSPTPPQLAATEPPLQTKFCRECGADLPRESKYCEKCGKKLA